MTDKRQLNVYMNGREVGTLAETKDHLAAFEYCSAANSVDKCLESSL